MQWPTSIGIFGLLLIYTVSRALLSLRLPMTSSGRSASCNSPVALDKDLADIIMTPPRKVKENLETPPGLENTALRVDTNYRPKPQSRVGGVVKSMLISILA